MGASINGKTPVARWFVMIFPRKSYEHDLEVLLFSGNLHISFTHIEYISLSQFHGGTCLYIVVDGHISNPSIQSFAPNPLNFNVVRLAACLARWTKNKTLNMCPIMPNIEIWAVGFFILAFFFFLSLHVYIYH